LVEITFGRGVEICAEAPNGVLGGNAGNNEGGRVGFGAFLTTLLVSSAFVGLDFFVDTPGLGVTAAAVVSRALPASKAGNSSSLRPTWVEE